MLMGKPKLLILIWFITLSTLLPAQVFDDFSDGDLTANPAWIGDTAQFCINAQRQLQLDAADAGNAYLSVNDNFTEDFSEWRFSVKMPFAPSGNNYARFYLSANTSDLRDSLLSGYFLQFGEAGSNDVIVLCRQQGPSITPLCRGRTSIAGSFHYNIKVVRGNALWTLFVDSLRNGIYTDDAVYQEFEETTEEHASIGIFCQFTFGNKNKFFFDDIYHGPPLIDTLPPTVSALSVSADHPDRLTIHFSEPMEEESVLDATHYILENQESPALCEYDGDRRDLVFLYFAQPPEERELHHLHIRDVRDANLLALADTVLEFILCIPHPHELLITEIMADPSPPLQLPDCEYVEIFNTTPYPILLKEWMLRVGNSQRGLPEIPLPPNGHALLVAEANLPLFADLPAVYPLSSLSLTDDGQQLTLYDNHGTVIHNVKYRKSWHRNPLKQDGGWSLEMIDPHNPCGGADNWDSSTDARGGTPGQPNAIAADNPDFVPPEVAKVTVPDDTHLRLFFTEPLAPAPPDTVGLFAIDREVCVVECTPEPPEYRTLLLTLSEPLRPRVIYTLTVAGSICDCAGNTSMPYPSFPFGLPESMSAGDIVINEVLSNPFADSEGDFVELYNRSDKLLDLGELRIGTGDGNLPTSTVTAAEDGYLFFPEQLVAICKNRDLTRAQYASTAPARLLENTLLPALPNDAGTIHLVTPQLETIDRLQYDKSMHYALLTSTDGVSLERIHYDEATQEPANWTSAAESSGWATPGAVNSQARTTSATTTIATILPDVISPDGDGFNDFTEILCHFPESECRATIDIYDSDGRRIKRLTVNQICRQEETFRWDGTTDDNRPANDGIHFALIQWWHSNGKHKTSRIPVAVIRKE